MSHYDFNWFAILPLVTATCCLVVGFVILRRDWTSHVGQALFGGITALVIYLGAFGMMYLAANPPTALLWARAAHVAIPLLPVAIYIYITVGLRQYKRDKVLVWGSVVLALAFIAMVFGGDLLLADIEKHWWGYFPRYGPAGFFLAGYFGLVIVLGMANLWGRLRESPEGSVYRKRLAWLMISGVIACVPSFDFLATFGVPVVPLGYLAVFAFLAVILVIEKRYRIVYMTPAVAADQILATMQGAVLVADPEGRVEVSNRAASSLLGYSEAEFVGLPLQQIFTSETEWRSVLDDCLKEESIRGIETTWTTKGGGSVAVSVSASLLADTEEELLGIVLAGVDITARKKAEEALRESERQLRQSQKMEAVGQLAGGIAHDFNNLLTAIIGNSSLALSSMAPDDPNRPLVADIKEMGDRAAALTKQVLAFSRRQMLRPQVLNLNDVIVDMEPVIRQSLGEAVDLRLSLAPDLKQCEIDLQQLCQVLVNLSVNAGEAMPDGGTLVIETRNTVLDADYCRTHRETKPGGYVMLAVSDSGAGMDKATQERLFEPFFTTKGLGRGTGLGLSTVYGIVKQSGGNLSVYSEPGEGTSLRVYLPAIGSSTAPATTPAPAAEEAGPGSARILVVEDEAPVRGLVVRVLSQSGYEVMAAGSIQEVETIVDSDDSRPDLLLTDVVLPGGANGKQVADLLLERLPGLHVVFMSGYTRNAVVHDGRVDDGIAFLEKPFNAETLLSKVREVLSAGPVGGPRP
ncbi:MAG: response regulator [Thermoleophilia bacterium]|nr:response regulator [Thermoleophilia bacterium]